MEISEQIKKARADKGITQAELSKKIGVTVLYISQLERGVSTPSIKKLKQLADFFGVIFYVKPKD